ncbi:MAG: hypothetical protein BGO82_07125 [Devosia sp. 67-54]|nr:MAG: hypothetical protein BGO82_07125 [Devosia sp. 67-54]
MMFNHTMLASGTCFFWRNGAQIYLISNWHNFAGLDPSSGKPLSAHGGIPNKLKFTALKQISDADAAGYFAMKLTTVTVDLYEGEFAESRWKVHPTHGQLVDVGAIDVTSLVRDSGLSIRAANDVEDDAVLPPFASQDVFILGFPLGLIVGSPAPVWKRGTIASDPSFDIDDLPKLVVDTATRKGMSGSVVLARHTVFGQSIPKKDGTMSEPYVWAKRDIVLGIYSGRIGSGEMDAQLGIVWRRSVIDQTVAGNTFYIVK